MIWNSKARTRRREEKCSWKRRGRTAPLGGKATEERGRPTSGESGGTFPAETRMRKADPASRKMGGVGGAEEERSSALKRAGSSSR